MVRGFFVCKVLSDSLGSALAGDCHQCCFSAHTCKESKRPPRSPAFTPLISVEIQPSNSKGVLRISCPDARIGDRITNRKMVDDLPLFGPQVEMTMHLIIVEGADTGGTQPECLSG